MKYITKIIYNDINWSSGTGYATVLEPYNITDGEISICQLGEYDSPLEACYSAEINTTFGAMKIYTYISAVVHNDFTSYLAGGINSETSPIGEPIIMSYKGYNDNNVSVCLPRYSGDTRYSCFGTAGKLNEYFLMKNIDSGIYPSPFIIGELDGNYSSPEIIFTDGDVESVRWNLTNYDLPDWEATFDKKKIGSLWLQDISGDNRNELIYMDNTYLRIYSMNHTPASFENYEYFSTTTTTAAGATTTTSTTINPELPEIFSNVQNNIKIIVGLIIVLGLCIIVATRTSSVIVIVLAGVCGVILSASLGFFEPAAVVLIIIVLAILMVLGLTLFRNNGG